MAVKTVSFYYDDYLTLNHERHEVRVLGRPLEITPIEWGLLECLTSHAGRVVGHDALYAAVYQEPPAYSNVYNIVKWHIANLRRKLHTSQQFPIKTVRGYGYRYDPPGGGALTCPHCGQEFAECG